MPYCGWPLALEPPPLEKQSPNPDPVAAQEWRAAHTGRTGPAYRREEEKQPLPVSVLVPMEADLSLIRVLVRDGKKRKIREDERWRCYL